MSDGMPMRMDNRDRSSFERLLSWFGRLHLLSVHFPTAFFPAALLAAVAGRRRAAFAALVPICHRCPGLVRQRCGCERKIAVRE
jgi:hypothetical protein